MRHRARIDHDKRIVAKLWSDFHYDIGNYLLAGTGNEQYADDIGNPFSMIDVDSLEYCQRCRTHIAVIELKHANESSKIWTQTEKLGRSAKVPAFMVVVHVEDDKKIVGFQVYKPGWPQNPDIVEPDDFAMWLANLHREHAKECAAMRSHLARLDQLRSRFRKAV